MTGDILFRPADSESEIAAAVSFMAKAPMHYPRYEEWLERSRTQMLAVANYGKRLRTDA